MKQAIEFDREILTNASPVGGTVMSKFENSKWEDIEIPEGSYKTKINETKEEQENKSFFDKTLEDISSAIDSCENSDSIKIKKSLVAKAAAVALGLYWLI